MPRPLYIVSLGGNALSTEESALGSVMEAVHVLYSKGNVVITHGNGPQVGELSDIEHKPLAVLTAQTEAEIGIYLGERLMEYFRARHKLVSVDTVLTKVLVDSNDPAFRNPSKPIGRFYSRSAALNLSKKGFKMKKLIGGYRRVVPSPKPVKIINIDEIAYQASLRHIVIAAGGGGIPMFKDYKLAEGVIDKDYATALLASQMGARAMFILTNVEGAYLYFGTKGQRLISKASISEMEAYIRKGFFEEGSMKPKVEACVDYVKKTGGKAAIGDMSNALDTIAFKGCTLISR